MRRSSVIVIAICILAIGLILAAYCTRSPAPEPVAVQRPEARTVSPSVTSIPFPAGPFSLEQTNRLAAELQLDLPNETADKEIRFIQAEDIDNNGSAMYWVYGVNGPRGESMLVYDSRGWTAQRWLGNLSYKPIDINSTKPLGDLMQENGKILARTAGEKRQVELWNDTYHITITGKSGARTYAFDAITGTLVDTP